MALCAAVIEALNFGFYCLALFAGIFVCCVALSIALGWISDNFTGKELDE